jgi:hypothetical protein
MFNFFVNREYIVMSAIPKSFFPFVSELAEFSRNKLRVNTQGAVTASPGDVTILTLPEGKLALDTFSLGGFVTTTTSAGFAAVQSIEHLVEQYQIDFGGISVTPGSTFYNQIFQLHNDYQGSWNKVNMHIILQLLGTSGTVTANQTSVPFQMNQWLGFLNDVKVLPADRTPVCRLHIKWASPSVLACGPNGATPAAGASYSIDKLYAMVDLLALSPVYDQLITDKLSKAPIQIPFTNFSCVPTAASSVGAISARWSTLANTLEKIYATALQTTYQDANQVGDATTFYSPALTKGASGLTGASDLTSRYTINGVSYPNTPLQLNRGEILLSTLETMNEAHDITSTPHSGFDSLTKFAQKWFVHGHNFGYDDDESGSRLCGLSGMGNNLLGRWETVSSVSTSVVPLLILQHRGILEIGGSRNVRYVH